MVSGKVASSVFRSNGLAAGVWIGGGAKGAEAAKTCRARASYHGSMARAQPGVEELACYQSLRLPAGRRYSMPPCGSTPEKTHGLSAAADHYRVAHGTV
jgi:hypothetical protein